MSHMVKGKTTFSEEHTDILIEAEGSIQRLYD